MTVWHPLSKDVFSDVDGDVLTIKVTLANGSPLPAGIIYDPVRGIGTDETILKPGQVFSLEATATDPYGASTSDVFKVTVLSKFQYITLRGKNFLTRILAATRKYFRFR